MNLTITKIRINKVILLTVNQKHLYTCFELPSRHSSQTMSNNDKSYVCRPMEHLNLCREASLLVSTSSWRTCWLPLWVLLHQDLSAKLAIISSAPCEHSPSLWYGWLLYLDITTVFLNPLTNIICVIIAHLSELQCVSSRSTHGWLSLHQAVSSSQEWERTGRALWLSAGRACCFPTETNCHLLHTRQERHYSSSSRGSNRKSRAAIEWRWSTNYRIEERPEW